MFRRIAAERLALPRRSDFPANMLTSGENFSSPVVAGNASLEQLAQKLA